MEFIPTNKIFLALIFGFLQISCNSSEKDTVKIEESTKEPITVSSPNNALQEIASLDRETYGDPDKVKLVADARAALVAISDYEAGLYRSALNHWEEAIAIAQPDLRSSYLIGWVRTWLATQKINPAPEEAANAILKITSGSKIMKALQSESLATELQLSKFLTNRDILTKVKRRQIVWKDPLWPSNLSSSLMQINAIAAFDQNCKLVSPSSAETFRATFIPGDELEKKLGSAIYLTCSGESKKASEEMQAFLELPTPNDSEKAMLAKVFASEQLSFLYRDIGNRDAIATNYNAMVEQYQKLIQLSHWSQAQHTQLEIVIADREIWAARYLSLANEYKLAEKHGQAAVARLLRLQNSKNQLNNLQRRTLPNLLAEGYHALAYRVAFDLGQNDKIDELISAGEKIEGLSTSWKRRFQWYKGLNNYSSGKTDIAISDWTTLLSWLPKNNGMSPQILFWLARCYSDLNQSEKAKPLIQDLRENFPTDFYTIIAAREMSPDKQRGSVNTGLYIESFGQQGVPRIHSDVPPFLKTGPNAAGLLRAEILVKAGVKRFAGPLVKIMARDIRKRLRVSSSNLPYFVWLLDLQNSVGEHHQAISMTSELTKTFPTLRYAHPEIINIDYPQPFGDLFEAAADQVGIDKSLVYAIARQETAFRPSVRSPAGAIGLMQLVEHTGTRMAELIGLELQNIEETLIDPRYNLRAGATYLSILSKRYKGNLPATIAAYNAGEYAVDAWIERRKAKDEMLWIELIPFGETKNYVKNVWRNMEIYRALNGKPAQFPEVSDGVAAHFLNSSRELVKELALKKTLENDPTRIVR